MKFRTSHPKPYPLVESESGRTAQWWGGAAAVEAHERLLHALPRRVHRIARADETRGEPPQLHSGPPVRPRRRNRFGLWVGQPLRITSGRWAGHVGLFRASGNSTTLRLQIGSEIRAIDARHVDLSGPRLDAAK